MLLWGRRLSYHVIVSSCSWLVLLCTCFTSVSGTGFSPGEVPISIIHSTLLRATQFAATLSLNSKQFRKKSGEVLIMWGTLMLGTALQTRFLMGWGRPVWGGSILRWMARNSSHLRNRSAASASGNSLGTQGTIRVPIPGSASQNLHAILYSTCICIQKAELLCTVAILDVQDSPREG